MKCEYCQEFIPEGKKFCGHCGKPVKKIPAEDFKTLKHPPQKIKEKRELPEEKSRLIAKKTQGEKQEMKGRKRKTIYWILAAVIVTIFLVVAFIPQDHIFAIGWHDYDDNNILSQQEPISENRSFTRFFHTYSTYFRWNTKTESQAIDFRDKTNIRISVNGEVLDFDEHCRIEDYYIPGTDTHHCQFNCDIPGNFFRRGENIVAYTFSWSEKITDGVTNFGPGTQYERIAGGRMVSMR